VFHVQFGTVAWVSFLYPLGETVQSCQQVLDLAISVLLFGELMVGLLESLDFEFEELVEGLFSFADRTPLEL
jgi:hypothetical protein